MTTQSDLPFHPDWRDWLSSALRKRLKRDTGREPSRPYLMRSIDKFARLVPHLNMRVEIARKLETVCEMVNKEGDLETWTNGSAARFLRYLKDIDVIEMRYAGKSGNALRLLKDFSVAPDPSRQSSRTSRQPAPKVEVDPMPAAPAPANPTEETVELDGTVMLSAIDLIAERLGKISLKFRASLSGAQAAEVYAAEATISEAVADLHLFRSAVTRGDGSSLQEILDR